MAKVFLAKSNGTSLDFGSEFNQARFREFLKENKDKWIRIDKPQPKRSGQQNKLYWAYLQIISREYGDDPVSLHEYFKHKLLVPVTKTIKGKSGKEIVFEVDKSTTDLNKTEMGEYMTRIAVLTEIPVPDPKLLENFIPNY